MYDEIMLKHEYPGHPEKPKRLIGIVDRIKEDNLWNLCHMITPRFATMDELMLAHDRVVVETVLNADFSEADLVHFDADTFANKYSSESARIAVGGLIELTKSVVTGENGITNGFAIIRPPGHHAEKTHSMGFCLFNNVAIAAEYAIRELECQRVLIFDWDVHHGNGTQHIFQDRSDVMYMSVHKGNFYPGTGKHHEIGEGEGLGYTVNLPFTKGGMGDIDYIFAFENLFMPIAREFNPDLVFISAGFDCAAGDPIGPMKLSTTGFEHMTSLLMSLAGGRVVMALEGGYNVEVSGNCASAALAILMGGKVSDVVQTIVDNAAKVDILMSQRYLKKYWDVLDIGDNEELDADTQPVKDEEDKCTVS